MKLAQKVSLSRVRMCFCFSNARFKFSKLNLMIHIVELNEHFAHFNVIEAVTPVSVYCWNSYTLCAVFKPCVFLFPRQ